MVLIDMPMPKNCYECPMNVGEYSSNEIEKRYCALTNNSFMKKDYKKRPACCPITDVVKGEKNMRNPFKRKDSISAEEELTRKKYDELKKEYEKLKENYESLIDTALYDKQQYLYLERAVNEKREFILQLQNKIYDLEEELIAKNKMIQNMAGKEEINEQEVGNESET